MSNTISTTQGQSICPWGVSHKTVITPTKQFIGDRKGFIVETHYYLRTRLPVYVKRLYQSGVISAEKMKEVFTLFEAHFNAVTPKRSYQAISCFFHDVDAEIAVKLTVNDETYNKNRFKELYDRFKDMLDEILDFFRDVLSNKIQESTPYKFMGYYLHENGRICFSRSP